jgi:signal transduction histidine kinase
MTHDSAQFAPGKLAPHARLAALLQPGSLARHLILRLVPPVLVLIVLDLIVTWVVTSRIKLSEWVLHDIFWVLLLGQVLLVLLIAGVLIAGVRSGLKSINRLSDEINQRSIDDLQPVSVAGLTTEITPVVTRINDLLVRLNDSMLAQRRFIGHAAHQLRTPLSGLKLESELMLAGDLPDNVRERAQRIKSVTDRMIRLGQQLLVLARADSSVRPQDSFQRLDLAEWARLSAAEWIPAARTGNIDLQLLAPEEHVWVEADPLLLEEMLSNLIDNALRYGMGARHIRVQVGATPPSLMVEDDGQGIDVQDRDRVFEAFYRSPKAIAGGSGLGLAIVREIALAHGAWWGLTSYPEFHGTRISVVFPGPRKGAGLTRRERQA